MAKVNIPRDIEDPFYRYTMPPLVAKVEKGTTNLANISAVAKSLARPPSYLTLFFSYELGTKSTIIEDKKDKKDKREIQDNKKEKDNNKGTYLLKGRHEQAKLNTLLDDFIDQFVCCKKCERNPETIIVIKEGKIRLQCKACGGSSRVSMSHKLCKFIINNPPPEEELTELEELTNNMMMGLGKL